MNFKIAQNFTTLVNKFVTENLFKMAQSGHTGRHQNAQT